MKTILITGAHGFLGRHTALAFKNLGWRVLGVGYGQWQPDELEEYGLHRWIEAAVTKDVLANIQEPLDCVFHCAGGSSVSYSVENPLLDFQQSVNSAITVLEYLRITHPEAKFIYPSSAAVYGNQPDVPISEDFKLKPISPYGYYKKIIENLCESYFVNYGLSSVVIRFFSIYGEGLEKQLLWDACSKLTAGRDCAEFFGTGKETRDWLNVSDAASLVSCLAQKDLGFAIFNGGSGSRVSVAEILSKLVVELKVSTEVVMGGQIKVGDPVHYWADNSTARELGWEPEIELGYGIREYASWFGKQKNI